MKPSIPRPRALLAAAVAALACASSTAAEAPYVLDSDGQPMRNGSAMCWRTGYWTPAAAGAAQPGGRPAACACEPDLLPAGACEQLADAPAPAPRPHPAPQASPVSPPPISEMAGPIKVKLSAEARFRFNTSVIEAESRARLDELARELEGIELEVLLAVGHADRIGGERYNQEISEKRAAEVKAYLIGKGVAADRIYTEGKGEKQPAHLGDCDDLGAENGANRALIDCLAADRRVEIEVIGVR